MLVVRICGLWALTAAYLWLPSNAFASGPNLLVNGGFEDPQLPFGSWSSFPTIPGWNLAWGSGIEVQNHVAGSPFEGNQHVELDSFGPSAMFQDVATIPGMTYHLTVSHSARPGVHRSEILVRIDGVPVRVMFAEGAGKVETSWWTYSYAFRAAGGTTRIQFEDFGLDDSLGGYLDAASLEADVQPRVLSNPIRGYNPGSAVPIKIQIDSNGLNISNPALCLRALAVYRVGETTPLAVVPAAKNNIDCLFRYSPLVGSSGGYYFNLDSTGMTRGNYRLAYQVGNLPVPFLVGFRIR